jgi:DNA-binding MarR family transcriptional regulator
MSHATRKTFATVGVMAAVGAGGTAIAGAAGGSSGSGTAQREAESALTGDTAAKVKAAALAKVEGGTIIRVETDADHGSPYEAHVRRADGTEIVVLVDESFAVTAVNEMCEHGPGGPGGHGPGMDGPAIGALAERLGVTRARLTAAFKAVGAAGRPDRDSPAADLASALGVEQSAVERILEANRPSGPRERPAPGMEPDHADLVAALASGLGIDEAKVQAAIDKLEAAHRAGHDDHHAELAAALAKQLGLKAADVAAALEAVRPDPPRRP